MTTYKMKLTSFQIRALIGLLVEYRNVLIGAGKGTDDVDRLLLMVLDAYEKK